MKSRSRENWARKSSQFTHHQNDKELVERLKEDKELQESIKNMDEIGINLLACKGCADQYEVSDDLEKLGIEVKYTGVELTDFIKGIKSTGVYISGLQYQYCIFIEFELLFYNLIF
jgi:hypothetical protein